MGLRWAKAALAAAELAPKGSFPQHAQPCGQGGGFGGFGAGNHLAQWKTIMDEAR